MAADRRSAAQEAYAMCLEYHLEFLGTLFGMSGARRAEEHPGSDGRQ